MADMNDYTCNWYLSRKLLRAFNTAILMMLLGGGCTSPDYVSAGGVPLNESDRAVRVLRAHDIRCRIESTTGPQGIYVQPKDRAEAVRLLEADAREHKYTLISPAQEPPSRPVPGSR